MKDLWNPIRVSLCVAVLLFTSCGSDNGSGPGDEPDPYNTVRVDLFGAVPLGSGYIYQLWAFDAAGALSASSTTSWTGLTQFNVISGPEGEADTLVTPQGAQVTDNTFTNLSVDLEEFDALYVTIEANTGMATTPSSTVYLQADIPDNLNAVSIVGFEFPVDYSGRTGFMQLATPTDSDTEDEFSGVWFMQFVPYQRGLIISDAPDGWKYEGWVYHDATWLSTGRFTSPTGSDEFNGYSGQNLPGFPGEDFLNNPPNGVTFPWVLEDGDKIAVTIEPHPDTDPDPFPIELFSYQLTDPVNSNIVTPMNKPTNTIPSGNGHIKRGN